MNQDELETAFRVYWDEILRCEHSKCYWALLHMIVALPDICAALESPDGCAEGDRYIDWCDRYVADNHLSGTDWYGIRCAILHQGHTRTKRLYSFSQPNNGDASDHGKPFTVKGVEMFNLNVHVLATNLMAGMTAWFHHVAVDTGINYANVTRNISSLAGVPSRADVAVPGLVLRFSTASPH